VVNRQAELEKKTRQGISQVRAAKNCQLMRSPLPFHPNFPGCFAIDNIKNFAGQTKALVALANRTEISSKLACLFILIFLSFYDDSTNAEDAVLTTLSRDCGRNFLQLKFTLFARCVLSNRINPLP